MRDPALPVEQPLAVVLLSGGLDSATTLYEARARGFRVHSLAVSYGQRHEIELASAQLISAAAQVERHHLIEVRFSLLPKSALTRGSMDLPKGRDPSEMTGSIPSSYVPARNTVLLGLAMSLAESLGARDIFIGVNAVDYSGYPDCRPEFIEAFNDLSHLATREGVEGRAIRVHAPLVHLNKAEIIRHGLALGVNYGLTHSCYDPGSRGHACGECDSCRIRLAAFDQVGVPDPAPYQRRAV
jgi:7-cyano-7-deazaguanine synthase